MDYNRNACLLFLVEMRYYFNLCSQAFIYLWWGRPPFGQVLMGDCPWWRHHSTKGGTVNEQVDYLLLLASGLPLLVFYYLLAKRCALLCPKTLKKWMLHVFVRNTKPFRHLSSARSGRPTLCCCHCVCMVIWQRGLLLFVESLTTKLAYEIVCRIAECEWVSEWVCACPTLLQRRGQTRQPLKWESEMRDELSVASFILSQEDLFILA